MGLILIIFIGASYAWLTQVLSSSKSTTYKVGTFSLMLDDTSGTGIELLSTVPVSDEVGLKTSPYTFTLTNNGTVESGYTIYLDDVELVGDETRMLDSFVRYHLTKDDIVLNTALLSEIGTNPNRILESGTMQPNETHTYDLRLWIDSLATNEVMNTTFRGKIRVVAEQVVGTRPPTDEVYFTFNAQRGSIDDYDSENGPKDVVIPSEINGVTIKSIDHNAFQKKALTSVVLPENLTSIGNFSFEGNNLTEVVIPDSVTNIGGSSFANNDLASVSISKNATTIGGSAFSSNELEQVSIPGKVVSIGSSAFAGNQLTSVVIQDGIQEISLAAFQNNKIKTLILPDSITSIGNFAFQNNQLESVVLSSNITSIGNGAFRKNASSNKALASIINPSGNSFAWKDILGGTVDATFVTGVVPHNNGDVVVSAS